MSGPIGGVPPRNDAFGGGTKTPASNPVGVSGSFGGPGASGFPAPGQPPILSARNNSGSNVRIPYARLVPMRGKQAGVADNERIWATIPDIALRNGLNGRMIGQEYDGLESGELAWIMGRRYVPKPGAEAGSEPDLETRGPGGDPAANVNVALMNTSAHGLGVGYGPDRMQRLAYQGYMEAYFRAVFGQRSIDLANLRVCSPVNKYLVAEIDKLEGLLGGATVLDSVDVFHAADITFGVASTYDKTQYPDAHRLAYSVAGGVGGKPAMVARPTKESGFSSGLFVMEKGPFLRGKIVEDEAVLMPETNGTTHLAERNLGDSLAFEALYATMRSQSFFDWQPDGMVLSKLESPAGEPYSSMELDARQAQLFNVGVQGPCIAKTWTGDPKMQTMPMDKVFVVIVADVVSKIGAPAEVDNKSLWKALKEFTDPKKPGSQSAKAAYDAALAAAKQSPAAAQDVDVETYGALLNDLYSATKDAAGASTDADRQAATAAASAARAEMDKYFKVPEGADARKSWATAWDDLAEYVKQGMDATAKDPNPGPDGNPTNPEGNPVGVVASKMTNFRLMRCTSSFFTQYSSGGGDNPTSRCGLRLGTKDGAKPASGGVVAGEYIIGGWCIGTVLDNAASRSTIGSTVRVAPASMAINVNVNVEWWSGDKLYRNYMDVDGQVLRRDAFPPPSQYEKRIARVDVSNADLPEKKVKAALPDPP